MRHLQLAMSGLAFSTIGALAALLWVTNTESVGWEVYHGYAGRHLISIYTGEQPIGVDPTSEEVSSAKAICEPLRAQSGLSFEELAYIPKRLPDVYHVDETKLYETWLEMSALRRMKLVLFGLASQDWRALNSAVTGSRRERSIRDHFIGVMDTCRFLTGGKKFFGAFWH